MLQRLADFTNALSDLVDAHVNDAEQAVTRIIMRVAVMIGVVVLALLAVGLLLAAMTVWLSQLYSVPVGLIATGLVAALVALVVYLVGRPEDSA